jgi:hypothetical protein
MAIIMPYWTNFNHSKNITKIKPPLSGLITEASVLCSKGLIILLRSFRRIL